MGREKRNLPASVAGGPKERHRRAQRSQYDPKAPVPTGFVAKPAIPKSKHHSYFEFVTNKNKKKKLEHQVTTDKTPPPGFEFVPIGNPELTTACKELSRERDAMIFIVSNSKEADSNILAHQVHRIGHHIREVIVDEARASLGQTSDYVGAMSGGSPEPIPKSQEEYNAQVDAAIRDLFPRVPNTDRQMIIEHAFRRGTTFKGDKPVGLSEDITLARRVQLAVLAHIRHTHTRYDNLLKETTWQNARKVVESLCLDTLVKWRGDDETGRDQLDEILREVVVISDDEDDNSDQETDESSIEEPEPRSTSAVPTRIENNISGQAGAGHWRSPKASNNHSGPLTPIRSKGKVKKAKRKTSAEKKGQRGFKRYQNAWQEALQRYREEHSPKFQAPPTEQAPNHHQIAPHSIVPYSSHEFPERSGLRISSAGPAPNENGYVAQPSFMNGHPVIITRQSYSPLPRPQVHDKVMTPKDHDSPVLHRPISMVTNRLQDMLVPSIEPNSPEAMRPSFIRPVPPRGQDFNNGSPIGPSMQYSPRRPSPSRGAIIRDEPIFSSNRRVVQRDRFPPGDIYSDRRGHVPNITREHDYVSMQDGYPVSDSPVYRYDGRPIEPHQSIVPPRRPIQDVPRLGERANPILMEDRGGFFERVSAPHPGAHPLSQPTRTVEFRQPVHEVRRVPDHRDIPWQEGPRILRETRNSPGVAPIPVTGVRPPPYGYQTRGMLAEPAVIQSRTPNDAIHHRGLDRDPFPLYHRPELEPRPHPRDSIMFHPEPPRGLQYNEQLRIDHHGQPMSRRFEDQPPPLDNQHNNRRGFPLHPHRPEDVIVIE